MATAEDQVYDVLVIGGGVVGCAVLAELTKHGYQCLLVEKEPELLSGASSGNSGIVHTGFDVTPNTLEAECLYNSLSSLPELHAHQVTTSKTGAVLVAWSVDEVARLELLKRNAHAMGVHNLRQLTSDELILIEPNLCHKALGGLMVPSEAAIDSWLLPITLVHHGVRGGAQVRTNCKVLSGCQHSDGKWVFSTTSGDIRALCVINAAGLHGDTVEAICQPPKFGIKPRKGQFVVYSKEAGTLIRHMILPVPTEITKGVLVFKSAYGHLVVGPTAEDCDERDSPTTSDQVSQQLIKRAHAIIPALAQHKPIAVYAGLRPATETKDYHIYTNREKRWVTVAGIRSTGLSACLGIARKVVQLVESNTTLGVKPSCSKQKSPGVATWWPTADGSSVVMDGVSYAVTHPLSRLGLSQLTTTSKL